MGQFDLFIAHLDAETREKEKEMTDKVIKYEGHMQLVELACSLGFDSEDSVDKMLDEAKEHSDNRYHESLDDVEAEAVNWLRAKGYTVEGYDDD